MAVLKEKIYSERTGAFKPHDEQGTFLGKRKVADPILTAEETAQERLLQSQKAWKKIADEQKRDTADYVSKQITKESQKYSKKR